MKTSATTNRILAVILSFGIRSLVVLLAAPLALDSIAADAKKAISGDRELQEVDLTKWNCLNRSGGTGRTSETVERNALKNRPPVDLSSANIPSMDVPGFLRHVASSDAQTSGKRRKVLKPEEKQQIDGLGKQIVSLTGYLVLAYAGPPESTNCSSTDFHDWHLEIFERPLEHPPQPGDPTPIICEITPHTQNALYLDGVRIQELSAFFRRPDVTYESTGHKAERVRITGYLLWDDEHNGPKDTGTLISSIARNRYHNPWRATAWEIHPAVKIERLAGAMPQAESRGSPATETKPIPSPSAPAAATPQRYVTILRQVKIKIPYGETVLPRGMRLPIISHDEQTVTVEYLGQDQVIPIASTDLRATPAPNR